MNIFYKTESKQFYVREKLFFLFAMQNKKYKFKENKIKDRR